jgi:hypothetical protein
MSMTWLDERAAIGRDDDDTWGRRPYAYGQRLHPLSDPKLVDAFLDQGDAWCGAGNEYLVIATMEPSHALNAAKWILNHARDIALTLATVVAADYGPRYVSMSEPAYQAVLDDVAARRMLFDRPLVRALVQRSSAQSYPTQYPWEAVVPRPRVKTTNTVSAAVSATVPLSPTRTSRTVPERDYSAEELGEVPF